MIAHAFDVSTSASEEEKQILILAPYGQDAVLLAGALHTTGMQMECLSDIQVFARQIIHCAAGVLTTDALNPEAIHCLQTALHSQSPWSDVPLILLSNRIDTAAYTLLAQSLGNVTIIGRPLESASLLTVVHTALRARKRQYQVRELLSKAEQQNVHILGLNERLKRAMTETHHRVKNSLQLISAFVDMQAMSYEEYVPVSELERINRQVQTLAAVHDVLTQQAKQDRSNDLVSSKMLLDNLFLMIERIAGGKRLHYDVEDLRLTSGQATSLALIANELILNALKHSGNEVEVTLQVKDEMASLIVCDNGTGLPEDFDVLQKSNTGLALVESLARWDLQGKASYTNRQDRSGAKIVISFPTYFE